MRERSILPSPKLSTMALVLCAVFLPSVASSKSDKALSRGDIDIRFVDKKGYDTPEARIEAVVDAPPAQVWKVINDCGNYENTMPRIDSSRLLKKKSLGGTKSELVCEIIVDMPTPFSNLVAVTRAKHTAGPKEWSRKWTLIRGDYTVNNGSWVLTPFNKEGTRTRVKYRLHAEPTTSIPDWIRIRAQKSSFPDMIERLREETKKAK